jgi:hypothetical protein
MIEWMKTLPQDAEVECGVEDWETYMTMAPVDIGSCVGIDYSSEESKIKYPGMAGKIIIELRGG